MASVSTRPARSNAGQHSGHKSPEKHAAAAAEEAPAKPKYSRPPPLPSRRDHQRPEGGRWTKDEDERLRLAIKELGPTDWRRISADWLHGRRTEAQCLDRWRKVLEPGLVKGAWTREEDTVIIKSVAEGLVKWGDIADRIPGRIGKQCRERWFNHLDPSLKKGNWSGAEDQVLVEAQSAWGNSWTKIARLLPGRSENQVKNRWNSATRRRQLEMEEAARRKRADAAASAARKECARAAAAALAEAAAGGPPADLALVMAASGGGAAPAAAAAAAADPAADSAAAAADAAAAAAADASYQATAPAATTGTLSAILVEARRVICGEVELEDDDETPGGPPRRSSGSTARARRAELEKKMVEEGVHPRPEGAHARMRTTPADKKNGLTPLRDRRHSGGSRNGSFDEEAEFDYLGGGAFSDDEYGEGDDGEGGPAPRGSGGGLAGELGSPNAAGLAAGLAAAPASTPMTGAERELVNRAYLTRIAQSPDELATAAMTPEAAARSTLADWEWSPGKCGINLASTYPAQQRSSGLKRPRSAGKIERKYSFGSPGDGGGGKNEDQENDEGAAAGHHHQLGGGTSSMGPPRDVPPGGVGAHAHPPVLLHSASAPTMSVTLPVAQPAEQYLRAHGVIVPGGSAAKTRPPPVATTGMGLMGVMGGDDDASMLDEMSVAPSVGFGNAADDDGLSLDLSTSLMSMSFNDKSVSMGPGVSMSQGSLDVESLFDAGRAVVPGAVRRVGGTVLRAAAAAGSRAVVGLEPIASPWGKDGAGGGAAAAAAGASSASPRVDWGDL